jgi:hypothetical protein
MKTWSFKKLRELCRKKGISERVIAKFSTYATSLDWRYARAKFHAEQADHVWEELFAKSFTFGDEIYNVAAFSYEAYVEACVQSLHSMGDILGQIINIVILENILCEETLYLNRVADYMEQNGIASDILNELKKLINSNEFCYIKAFCNTIKHRRLIKSQFRNDYDKNYYKLGLVFDEFNYKVKTYPQTWGDDIIDKYREEIINLVIEVGIKISNYFK